MLERLAEYMMDNSGNLNSPNHVTVGHYNSYLRDAFVFYEAKRYDIKGKKYITNRRGLLTEFP